MIRQQITQASTLLACNAGLVSSFACSPEGYAIVRPKIYMTIKHIWLLFGFLLYTAGVFKFAKWYIFQGIEEEEWPPEMPFGDTFTTVPLFIGGILIVYIASTQFGTAAMSRIALFMIIYPTFYLAGFLVLKAFGNYFSKYPKTWARPFSVVMVILTIFYAVLLFSRLNAINFK